MKVDEPVSCRVILKQFLILNLDEFSLSVLQGWVLLSHLIGVVEDRRCSDWMLVEVDLVWVLTELFRDGLID